MLKTFLYSLVLLFSFNAVALELVISEERVPPGVIFVFEGAIKDKIVPSSTNLSESEADIHIEARVNWDKGGIPDGTPPGGFIPYLHIFAKVINQRTGLTASADLIPHVNLIDNFHYARNIALPGKKSDLYTVIFTIVPPSHQELALHKDWMDGYGSRLFFDKTFTYKSVDFEDIANATRR